MVRRKGPKGLIPRRKKPKSGHQKRTETLGPTPEMLRQKAGAQGRTVGEVDSSLPLEPLELLHHHRRINENQMKAAYKFAALRRSVFGMGTPAGGQNTVIHEHLSSDDAPDRLFTDDEIAEKRERDEREYRRACACLKTLGRREFECVQKLVVDKASLTYVELVKAKRGLSVLAEMWTICGKD
jgi:hypothetical protein